VASYLASLFENLINYGKEGYYPCHMPGHKRSPAGWLPSELAAMDITEIDGFDELHHSQGILLKLQQKAAKLYGAEESFYLVGGSTCGILSAVSAVVPQGGHILIARNCHSSVYHAAYLRKLSISYLYPPMHREYPIYEGVTAGQVGKALMKDTSIEAVVVVSPTYEGRIADIFAIAGVVHERGIPLIVDEAHGAHLGFHHAFAQNSCRLGADIVVHSVHKTLPALTQTALLHRNGSLVDRGRLKRFLRIYQSSSPSYVLMAGIDNALRVVEEEGEVRFRELSSNWRGMMEALRPLRNLKILTGDSGRQDIGKLVISFRQKDLSIRGLYDMLLQEYKLQLEMMAGTYLLALFTIGDKPEGFRRLTEALLEIDRRLDGDWMKHRSLFGDSSTLLGSRGSSILLDNGDCLPEEEECPINFYDSAIPLTEAWDGETETVFLDKSEGRHSGDFISLYPPGIPLVVPGEVFTKDTIGKINEYLKQGLSVRGIYKQAGYYTVTALM
jgi:arginine/lysine/ornithine decarboxylase